MIKTLIAILSVFALLSVSQADSGKFALNFVPGAGYLVNADIGRFSHQNFAVSLYSSKTIFASQCLHYDHFNCQLLVCKKGNSMNTVQTPYFTASGNTISKITLNLDNAWSIQPANGVLANNCNGPFTEQYGQGSVGLLGLGFEGNSRFNFASGARNFAVFYNQGMKLVFNADTNFNKNLIAHIPTDANWKINNVQAVSLGTLRNPLSGVSVIFDLNQDAIGLPAALYTTFVGAMSQVNAHCNLGSQNQPLCNYAGDISTLPNVQIETSSGGNILITPQMYALKPANGAFTLNMKALSPSAAGVNYIHNDWQNSIVLGNTVLGSYYTVFDLVDSSVTLYQVL